MKDKWKLTRRHGDCIAEISNMDGDYYVQIDWNGDARPWTLLASRDVRSARGLAAFFRRVADRIDADHERK